MVRRRLNGRGPAACVAVILLATATVAGCSGDDGDGGAEGGPVGGGAVTSLAVTPSTTDGRDVSSSTLELAAGTAEPIATVPVEGIPGIDSEDPFCRAWSEFAGSFQTLAFVSASESDPMAAVRLEVVAAAAVASAALELDTEFPDRMASEQEVFVDDVIGPFARRAARAVEELEGAGLTAAQLEVLGAAWLGALAETGVDDPGIVVTLPADLEAVVSDATASLAATVPPIATDPSLITQAETPMTSDYIAGQCPDQGTLAGNDAID